MHAYRIFLGLGRVGAGMLQESGCRWQRWYGGRCWLFCGVGGAGGWGGSTYARVIFMGDFIVLCVFVIFLIIYFSVFLYIFSFFL